MLIMTGILLAKFENYRIRKIINSLGSYITERKQTTRVNDDVSGTLRVVPYGSVLGPLIFLLYYSPVVYFLTIPV